MTIFDEMLGAYAPRTTEERLNAIHEVMQQVVLCGLYRGGFFKKAAFYGGTCLRIFHGLPRFSEDMDFSLTDREPDFRLEPYFDSIVDTFAAMGQKVALAAKEKTRESAIRSAFLKSETAQYDLHLERGRNITIKIEVDTTPPLAFETEEKLLLQPVSFYTRCLTLPALFAGKLHALIFRRWQHRVKGRDWYDFEWYVRHGVPLDFRHFCERVRQFGSARVPESPDELRAMLTERLREVPMRAVIADVRPFIAHPEELAIWSTDYFVQLAGMMKIRD